MVTVVSASPGQRARLSPAASCNSPRMRRACFETGGLVTRAHIASAALVSRISFVSE